MSHAEPARSRGRVVDFAKSAFTLMYHRKELENEFHEYYTRRFTPAYRLVYVTAMAVFLLRYGVEAWAFDQEPFSLYLGVIPGCVVPLVALAMTYTPFHTRTHLWVNALLFLVIAVVLILGVSYFEDEMLTYRPLLELFTLFFTFAQMLRLRFVFSFPLSWTALIMYIVFLAIASNQAPLVFAGEPTSDVLGALAMRVFYLLFGVVSYNLLSYHTELTVRHAFELRTSGHAEASKLRIELDQLHREQTQRREQEAHGPPDVPLTKALKLLQGIEHAPAEDVARRVDEVSRLLVSSRLYAPNTRDVKDNEIGRWLTNMLADTSAPDPMMAGYHARMRGSFDSARDSPKPQSGDDDDRQSEGAQSDASALALVKEVDQSPQLRKALEQLHSWELDIFEVATLTNGHPLLVIGLEIFRQENLLNRLSIREDTLVAFLAAAEAGYSSDVPYHNALHAADVLHASYFFLNNSGHRSAISDIDLAALLVGSAIHDYGHPGVNNAFLVNTSHPIALQYNDRSVLEQYHAAQGLQLLRKARLDITANFTKTQKQQFRAAVINNVLATDVAQHFEYVNKFESRTKSGARLSLQERDDLGLMMALAIKCADMSNPAKPRALNELWVQRIMEEFFRQGDQERARGRDVSTFMDRNAPNTPKCQTSFVDFLVRPMYKSWAAYVDADPVHRCCAYLEENYIYWKSQLQAAP